MSLNAMLAGLVAITPASGFVGPVGSIPVGVAAGIAGFWGCAGLKQIFGYDDALDAFGVQAVCGAVGAILTGVFAVEKIGQTAGLIEGNAMQKPPCDHPGGFPFAAPSELRIALRELARFKVVTEEVASKNNTSADRVPSLSFA
jgi:hypothetical protein